MNASTAWNFGFFVPRGGSYMSNLQKATLVVVLMTRTEAAEFLRLKPQTLAAWATRGTGPRVCKIGGKALYRLEDLQNFITGGITPR
jgi:hypothetical protein